MDAGTADLFQIVEYSRDRWTMEKTPLALLFFLAGMFFVIYVEPGPPGPGIVFAVIVLGGLMAFAILSQMAMEFIFEGRLTLTRLLVAALLIAVAVWLYWDRPDDLFRRHRGGPPPNVFGWMMIVGAIGWIVYAIHRHFNPARPMLMLSPEGVSYHSSLVKNLFIPWREAQGVDAVEQMGIGGYPFRLEDFTALLISKEFYDQNILIKRSILGGPKKAWDGTFIPKPKSPLMQMVLNHQLFAIDPKEMREPAEARWKAFRNAPPAPPAAAARRIYGKWTIDGSLWQAVKFLAPIFGVIAILLDLWLG